MPTQQKNSWALTSGQELSVRRLTDGYGELHRLEARIIHNTTQPLKIIPGARRKLWAD